MKKKLDYTLVLGVDRFHLQQLALTWPTWMKHKPSLRKQPLVMFYDYRQVSASRIEAVVDHPNVNCIAWPLGGLVYDKPEPKTKYDKWNDPHRAMMLAGFVYVPGLFVDTKYWLKLDTDVVATGQDDWIDLAWFDEDPAIVAHRWSFTKPANQMLLMDEWVDNNAFDMPISVVREKPLNLAPHQGSDRLGHKRIISWCGFFDKQWTFQMARLTHVGAGKFMMPIDSQDGFLWYMAARMGRKIVRANMKSRGWEHWSTMGNVQRRVREVMDGR